MARLLPGVTHRQLLYERANRMYLDIVCVVEVVAEIVFGEVERDEELGLVGREIGRADESDGELGPGSYISGCSSGYRK